MLTVGSFNSGRVTGEGWEYAVPRRQVLSQADMEAWSRSEAYYEYLGFVVAMNEAVEGKPLTGDGREVSPSALRLVALLDTLSRHVRDIPPVDQPQRFGNVAFRTWHSRLRTEAESLVREAVGGGCGGGGGGGGGAVEEVKEYLVDSFGNPTRIDYGTGHEMAFCMFLCSLFKIGALKAEDSVAVVCTVFNRYLEVVRELQTVYKMEPAGSRGVWALDDFQFIPFIWGSSQLIGNPRISPSMFVKDEVLRSFSKDFMFLGCIDFILQVKKGPFAEHSNQLWNISGVTSWEKVNKGLIKMYKAEVLCKFPVIQHVLFGSLFSLKKAEGAEAEAAAAAGAGRRPQRSPRPPPPPCPPPRPPAPAPAAAPDEPDSTTSDAD